MKNPFSRKLDPNALASAKVQADVTEIIRSLPLEDKVKVAAAVQTGGALELRLRMLPGGARKVAIWLYAANGEGFEVVTKDATGAEGPKP